VTYRIFLVTPTDEFEVSLRRYINHPYVAGQPYPDSDQTSVVIERLWRPDIPEETTGQHDGTHRNPYEGDPRWPRVGAKTGHVFTEDDGRVVDVERLYRLPDGSLATLQTLPVGAAFYDHFPLKFPVPSLEYERDWRGKRSMIKLKLPDGSWFSPDWGCGPNRPLDRPVSGWTVTGSIEGGDLSVSPSVHVIGSYHGWIGTAGTPPGFISRDIDGRPY